MSRSSTTRTIALLVSFASLALVACSSDDGASSSGTSGTSSTSSSGGSTSGTSGTSSSASSSGTSGSSGTTTSSGGSSGTVIDGIPAGDPAAFNAWLQKREYEAWPKESAPHPSTGPHGQSVQTYLNPKLDTSMKGTGEHPVGAASVKTFNDASGKVTGWAAMVKTAAASDGGKGWYWYEVFETSPGASPIAGQGLGTCTGCHSSGRDFVRAPYPLK